MSTQRISITDPERLVGEIIQQRYAVTEWLGGSRYMVFDMEQMRRRVMPLAPSGAPLSWEAVPPPVPPDARRAVRPAPPRRRVDTRRFEAAWFARGEQLEQEEEPVQITDYAAYQASLEKLALEAG